MQEVNPGGALSRPAASKPSGSWNVAYPMNQLDEKWGTDPVTRAKMTIQRLDSVVQGITTRHQNSMRRKMLRALLNKTNEAFTDPQWAALTIKRLANADSDVYPPVQGSGSDTTSHQHYVGTNFTVANISDSNNPWLGATGYTGIKDQLEEHFGLGEVVTFINNDQREKIRLLTAFVDRDRMNINSALTTDRLDANGLPLAPGQLIGAYDDALVFEWRWIPATYNLSVDLMQPAPLKQRLDPEASLQGFKLVAEFEEYPIQMSTWRDRFGFGVGNRLNGYAVFVSGTTTYATPTYAA